MKEKIIKVKEDTRFVICIDKSFDRVSLRDISQENVLKKLDCEYVLQANFNNIVKLIESLEKKSREREEQIKKEKKIANLKVIK